MAFENQIRSALAAGLSGLSLSSLGSEWEARGSLTGAKSAPILRVDLDPIQALRKVLQEVTERGKEEKTQLGVSPESMRNLENALDRLILAVWSERDD